MATSRKTKNDVSPEEVSRLEELYSYEILDTPDDSHFDQISQIAATVFDVPIAVISFVDLDRQWFKSKVGVEARETPRDIAFCHHTIQQDEVLIVPDATRDLRFFKNPLVTGDLGIRFYAGAPLITPKNNRLGSLCVIDRKPRNLSEEQIKVLKLLSKQVMDQLELKRIGRNLRQKNLELVTAQKKLQENTEFLNQVVNNLPLGLYCKDVNANFSYTLWNQTASTKSGWKPEQVIGKNDFDFNPPGQADRFREMDLKTLQQDDPVEFEEVIDVPTAGKIHLSVRQIPLKNNEGEVQYILGLAEDITQKKETQAHLIQTSKMSSLGEMAAGIAHEINNPLAVIRARAQMMRDLVRTKSLTEEGALKCAEKIEETSVRISKIISGLRNFAREGSQDPFQPVLLKELVDAAIELSNGQFKNKSVEMRLIGLAPNLQLECRSVQIIQVLINLLNNAVDAIANVEDRWVQLEIKNNDNNIELLLSDSGPGIPHNIRDRIMQPFFTTKEVGKGTGLGLSISKGIIESHSGSLNLDSTSPNTCFVIRLPKKQKKPQ